jgi:hypothetical protein
MEGVPSAPAVPSEAGNPELYVRARSSLLAYGVPPAEAEKLLALYPPERVLRQAGWMPLRGAREPSRFLVSAVVRDFGPPLRSRLRRRPLFDVTHPVGRGGAADGVPAAQGLSGDQGEDQGAAGTAPADLDGVSLEVPE